MIDVLIVGGGPAGLGAALILGRCRRHVLLCDAGEPRNAVSSALHGFLTRDGIAPDEFRRIAREQLTPYTTVEVRNIRVSEIAPLESGGFAATLAGGAAIEARKVLLATGVVDELPPIPGFRELYGRGVWHCVYCDGFELRDRPVAVYGRDAGVVAEARALTTLTRDLLVCCHERLEDDDRAALARMGAAFRTEQVVRLEPRTAGLAIEFAGGPDAEVAGLFFATGTHERSPLAAQLGCGFDAGGLVQTDALQATGVPGLWAAGDVTRSVLLAQVAAAEGVAAAFAIHKELLREAFEAQ